jgi:acyl phosphate:glycerol-3-phosphate acyltransferase
LGWDRVLKLKGGLACFVVMYFASDQTSLFGSEALSPYAAVAGAVIGCRRPIYFRFEGRKGALTAAAVIFTVKWQLAAIGLGLSVLIVAATRYVTLCTMCASIFFSILSFMPFFRMSLSLQIFAASLAAIIVLKHRENIQGLLSGTENKLSIG